MFGSDRLVYNFIRLLTLIYFSPSRLMSTVGKDLEAETTEKMNKGNNEEAKKMVRLLVAD